MQPQSRPAAVLTSACAISTRIQQLITKTAKTEHFCKFNNAYKVNHGHYGNVDLAGAKFWINGDLGGDFSQGQMDWAQVTFDKGATAEQRQALGEIIGHVFPVKWKSLQIAEGNIDTWAFDKDHAHATLNGGKTAEIKLTRFQGMTDEPAVLKNVKYWGTPRNDGFVMMPNEIETYREGPRPYEFKGTNGFMLTFDMTSKGCTGSQGIFNELLVQITCIWCVRRESPGVFFLPPWNVVSDQAFVSADCSTAYGIDSLFYFLPPVK